MGKHRTPFDLQFDTSPFAPPSFRSPYGDLSFNPGTGVFSFSRGPELEDSFSDESRRRNMLRQLLPELNTTSGQRESIRQRFEQAFYDSLRDRIQEDFSQTQRDTLEQLGARNLLGSSLEARRLGDLESQRMQSTLDAARQAILQSEDLARQDEEMKLALLKALEQGIAGEFARRLDAAKLVTGAGLKGADLGQQAQEFADEIEMKSRLEQARMLSDLIGAVGSFAQSSFPTSG